MVENPALINTGYDGHDLNISLNLRAAFIFKKICTYPESRPHRWAIIKRELLSTDLAITYEKPVNVRQGLSNHYMLMKYYVFDKKLH